MQADHTVRRASVLDSLGAVTEVLGPVLGRGVIIRRPPVVKLAERMDADSRAVRRMQTLRERYGPGPVMLAIPGRDVALVLEPDDVKRVLHDSPEPFATATFEKRGALGHFQPQGVLISHGEARAKRRQLNEQVLETHNPVHTMAGDFVAKVREEAAELLDSAAGSGTLHWDDYAVAWHRMVRRVVLGDAAREDHAVTDFLADLRADANWSFLKRRNDALRDRFLKQLQGHLDRAEPGSLAHLVATMPAERGVEPTQQVPQWLFAFDAAAWASFRALALLCAHPEHLDGARQELSGLDLDTPQELDSLRAAVLESLRLWPTTPAVLRDTTEETTWQTGTLPAGTGVVIFAPFFHRDDQRLDYADQFSPDLWLGGRTAEDWPLIPFSGGPGECPGRQLVLLTTSLMLGSLLESHDVRLSADQLDGTKPMPGTLSPFHLTFSVAPTS